MQVLSSGLLSGVWLELTVHLSWHVWLVPGEPFMWPQMGTFRSLSPRGKPAVLCEYILCKICVSNVENIKYPTVLADFLFLLVI